MPSGITLNKIEDLKRSMLNCNVFSVYDYDCLSMQELLCTFFDKINQCVDVTNKTVVLVEWLVSQGLKEEVAKKLEAWLLDGTLANIINDTVFKELNNKVKVNTQNIEALNTNLSEYKNDNDDKVGKINHKLDTYVFSDSYPTLQEAHDAVVVKGGGTLVINKDYVLTNTFRWDISKVSIDGQDHTLDFSGLVESYAIRTVSSNTESHPFFQATIGMERLYFKGNRNKGMFLFEGETYAKAVSHITISRCSFDNFSIFGKIKNNAYLIKIVDCDIFNMSKVIECLGDVTNSGENIQFRGCTIYNCTGGVIAKSGICDMFFTNCSFDYFERNSIFEVDNSKVYLNNCHIEFDLSKITDGNVPIYVQGDSGFINIDNTFILGVNKDNKQVPHIFFTTGTQARINLTKCFLHGLRTTSGWLCGGSGRLYTDKNIINHVNECDLKINPSTTQSASGSMTVNTITDAVLTEDTGDRTSLTGNNIQVLMVNDIHNYKYNTNIKINKSAGAGQVGAVRFFVPIQQGSSNNLAFVMKRVSGSGDINLTYGYCTYNGLNIAEEQKGWEAINLQGDWIHKGYFMTNAPMWATHMYINIATSNATESDIRIGEISANSF